jgi:anti-anti-sigma regulatory factor
VFSGAYGSGRSEVRSRTDGATRLEPHGVAVLDGEGAVTLDLSGSTFLDSSGLNSILALRNAAVDSGRSVRMGQGPENVMRVLAMVGLDDVFEMAD